MKRNRPLTPLLDRDIYSDDSYLAELSHRAHDAATYADRRSAISHWIN